MAARSISRARARRSLPLPKSVALALTEPLVAHVLPGRGVALPGQGARVFDATLCAEDVAPVPGGPSGDAGALTCVAVTARIQCTPMGVICIGDQNAPPRCSRPLQRLPGVPGSLNASGVERRLARGRLLAPAANEAIPARPIGVGLTIDRAGRTARTGVWSRGHERPALSCARPAGSASCAPCAARLTACRCRKMSRYAATRPVWQ